MQSWARCNASLGSFASNGFRFHPTARNKLVIEEDSAAVYGVSSIWLCRAVGNTDIARRLNSEGVLTPSAYFRQKNPGSGRFRKASEKNGWTRMPLRYS